MVGDGGVFARGIRRGEEELLVEEVGPGEGFG